MNEFFNSNNQMRINNKKNNVLFDDPNQNTNQFSTHNYNLPLDINLDGGTLLSITERDEVDPEDNCKVHITYYHILSKNGIEESTITKRRKFKINCTQSLKRIEYLNGVKSKIEEKATVFNNLDTLKEYKEQNIKGVLFQTEKAFISLLNEKKEKLLVAFPDLFSNLRTQPVIFESKPNTLLEKIVNPDGSTTTLTKSSKAFSSRYTCQETYLNGIRQERTTKFRAFIQYTGPESDFSIELNDEADEELSESEDIECIAGSVARNITSKCLLASKSDNNLEDIQSQISHSRLSEIPDSDSALVSHNNNNKSSGVLKFINTESLQKNEKPWYALNELVESEGRYVQILGLLEKFREEIEKKRLLDRRQMTYLFANIKSLYRFHNEHLLPQLMDRRREWQSTKKISDVMRKQAPFLKMYSEYTNNYKQATQTFEECLRKKKHFEEIVRRIERLPECENLSLISHLICPVQRVMRYQLLLKEYQKYLNETDVDYNDTKIALSLVLEAASHANEMMRKLDRYRNVLEVQEQLGSSISLVSPTRELLMKIKLLKISSTTNKSEERLLFAFSDLFLLVSERSSIGLISSIKYKLRAIFDARFTQICEGDNLECEYSFYLRGSDSQNSLIRCVELCCSSQKEKSNLFETLWAVISDAHIRQKSVQFNEKINKSFEKDSTLTLSKTLPAIFKTSTESKNCARCDIYFSWFSKSHFCTNCLKKFCKKCFGHLRLEKPSKLCAECLRLSDPNFYDGFQSSHQQKRQNLLNIPAYDTNDIIKASYVNFRSNISLNLISNSNNNGNQKYFILRKNFCLYSYKTDQDEIASAMMPMTGCNVSPSNCDKLSFTIRQMNRVYNIQCNNESEHAEWLASLILSAHAKLPYETQNNTNESHLKTVKRSALMSDHIINTTNF